jgi:hypothetical protein
MNSNKVKMFQQGVSAGPFQLGIRPTALGASGRATQAHLCGRTDGCGQILTHDYTEGMQDPFVSI